MLIFGGKPSTEKGLGMRELKPKDHLTSCQRIGQDVLRISCLHGKYQTFLNKYK
jgi:hypothetical protein